MRSILSLVWLQTLFIFAVSLSASAYDSSFDLASAQRYVALAGVAYCTNPTFTDDTVESWTCKACAGFSNVNATSFFSTLNDGNGFVAIDYDANEIIVSFSGTNPLSIRNWIDDLDAFQTSYPLCSSGCKVHKGFYNTYLSVQEQVLTLLKKYVSANPTAKISVTGHSLGAALAALCGADLVSQGYAIQASYTYGMPRVGDESFSEWYSSVMPGTFRVVHYKDPVPQVPLQSMNYHHMPYEVFYEKDDYSNWKLCSFDGEDPTCSDQYYANLDVLNHLNYLGFDFTTNWLSC